MPRRDHSLLPWGEGGRGTRPDEGALPSKNHLPFARPGRIASRRVQTRRAGAGESHPSPPRPAKRGAPSALRSPLSPKERDGKNLARTCLVAPRYAYCRLGCRATACRTPTFSAGPQFAPRIRRRILPATDSHTHRLNKCTRFWGATCAARGGRRFRVPPRHHPA